MLVMERYLRTHGLSPCVVGVAGIFLKTGHVVSVAGQGRGNGWLGTHRHRSAAGGSPFWSALVRVAMRFSFEGGWGADLDG